MADIKNFGIYEPVSKEFLEIAAARLNFKLEKDYIHPKEDYSLQSEKYPIFAVADGVTLELNKEGNYPNPSGAGEVARIFCQTILTKAENIYQDFSQESLLVLFEKTNEAVGRYNAEYGRTKDRINYWDFDLFATTGSFAIIKDARVYWASICDSYVAHFDKNGVQKFKSPDCWPLMRRNLSKNWDEMSEEERKKMIRRVYRNGFDENDNLIGYGVATGEVTASRYLNLGSFDAKKGEMIALFTDGFEEYLKQEEFMELFKEWSSDLENMVKKFTAQKTKENPKKFGHERSLFVIKF